MAYLVQPDYIKYLCSCGQLKPITNLYFCRHCLKIRCGFCICHEVDSHFCTNCLENMPSSEARLKKNRCSSCFDCPSCFHTLSTRVSLQQPTPSSEPIPGDGKVENKQPKKKYYLSCLNCRWTSRDVGIPDQPVASGGWPERMNPFSTRVNQLLDYYKAIAQQEKQDKIDKKYNMRAKYLTLTDKTGLTGAMARNLAGLPSGDASASSAITSFVPSQPSEEVDQLPDEIYTKEVDLKQITSMAQRLRSPEWQPALAPRLQPSPRPLAVKRSQRCRSCDHNLTKPEYNPGSVKFKIELLAFYHVPEVKIVSCEPLKPGESGSVLLKLSNPTGYEMQLRLLDPKEHPVETEVEGMDRLSIVPEKTEVPPASLPTCQRGLPAFNTRLVADSAALALAQRDDAAEYDDDLQATQPHHPMIVWRKSNKLVVRISASLTAEAEAGSAMQAALLLEYSYRNTVPPSASLPRHSPDHTLYATVVLNMGRVS